MKEMSIIDYIENYRKNPRILFTTPSHGQGRFVFPKSAKLLGKKFFQYDYSELDGFDNLAAPTGIIKNAQDKAAEIYGAKSTFFLINGSTSGIIAAMIATLQKGDKVLIARNCHKSIYNGLVLTGAVPVWLIPGYNEEWGIYETIKPEMLDEVFSNNKDIKVFIMTNPTYEGVMSDVYRISDICKKHNVLLIVDEAHGALWNFYKAMGTPSLLQGADIVVQSLHKTAGALNPSALLHIGKDSSVKPQKIRDALNLITTTSPSYPMLMNIEACITYLDSKQGKQKIYELLKNISKLIRSLRAIPNLKIYAYNNDISKILVKLTNVTGFELSDILYDKYNIECELANEKSVLLLTGVGTDKSKLKKLEKALINAAGENIKITNETETVKPFYAVEPRVRYTPASVWGKPAKEVELKYALSRVSMELIADYPPGIPVLLPGEVIRKEHINFLEGRKKIKVLL